MTTDQPGQATRSIHGTGLRDQYGSPHLPTYATTTFAFESTEALTDVVEGRTPGPLYTRFGKNPSIVAAEETMSAIEGAESALAFASGMAAEAALFAAYGREGIVCVGDVYGGTYELLTAQLPLLGIETTFLLGDELDGLDQALEGGARLVFLETPTNPGLAVFDVAAIAERAHAHGALLAIDNTFASPVNQRPLALGADLVAYSATKYLGGHSDLTAGLMLGSAELVASVAPWRKNLGSAIAPETAALLSRSLKTLTVRVRAQNASAQRIAEALEADPRVRRVLYPGLASFPGHELAAAQMDGFGGMITIEVAGDREATAGVCDRLGLFALAPSLGGAESLATQPVTITHHGMSPDERARRGITDSMVRLSVGLEDTDDLIADLTQALDAVAAR